MKIRYCYLRYHGRDDIICVSKEKGAWEGPQGLEVGDAPLLSDFVTRYGPFIEGDR